MLKDKIAQTKADLHQLIFGKGFGVITDLEGGPDGYLYVVSISQGKIFRIVHLQNNNPHKVTLL